MWLTPARSSRQPRPRSAIDLGDQRAEAAVAVVGLDRERDRHRVQQLGQIVVGRGVEAGHDRDRGLDAPLASSSAAAATASWAIAPDRQDRDVRALAARSRARPSSKRPSRPGSGVAAACRPGSRPAPPGRRSRAAAARACSRVGGGDDGHRRLRAHHGEVLERVVGDARCGRSRSRRRRRRCAPAGRAATGPLRMNSYGRSDAKVAIE